MMSSAEGMESSSGGGSDDEDSTTGGQDSAGPGGGSAGPDDMSTSGAFPEGTDGSTSDPSDTDDLPGSTGEPSDDSSSGSTGDDEALEGFCVQMNLAHDEARFEVQRAGGVVVWESDYKEPGTCFLNQAGGDTCCNVGMTGENYTVHFFHASGVEECVPPSSQQVTYNGYPDHELVIGDYVCD